MKGWNKVLYILSIVILTIGIVSFAFAIVFSIIGNDYIFDLFGVISSICGVLCLGLVVLRLVLFGISVKKISNSFENTSYNNGKKDIEKTIIDVKEVPKTREEELYEKYEELYSKNIITKDDLDKKRIELLGK